MKPLRNILEDVGYQFDPEKEFKNRSVGIISASRGHLPEHLNYSRNRELRKALVDRGHHVIESGGGFTENFGSPRAQSVYETSFIVLNRNTGNDQGHILGTLKDLGKKYDQDSVLYKPYNSDTAALHGTNESGYPGLGKSESVGTLKMNKKAEFHTKLPDGRYFSFDNEPDDEIMKKVNRPEQGIHV